MTDKHRERADTEWAHEEAEKIVLELAGWSDCRSRRISTIQTALLAAEQRGRADGRAGTRCSVGLRFRARRRADRDLGGEMTDLETTLSALTRMAEEVKLRHGERLQCAADHWLYEKEAFKSAPLLASAVLALVEVARAAQDHIDDGCRYGDETSHRLAAALSRLSTLKETRG